MTEGVAPKMKGNFEKRELNPAHLPRCIGAQTTSLARRLGKTFEGMKKKKKSADHQHTAVIFQKKSELLKASCGGRCPWVSSCLMTAGLSIFWNPTLSLGIWEFFFFTK